MLGGLGVDKNTDKILILIIVGIIALMAFRKEVTRSDVLSSENLISSGLVDQIDSEENPDQGPIFVHITGEVFKPDVYEMSPGSRMNDLIDLAGGFTDKANKDLVNLAAKLEDEMMVRIPSIDDEENPSSQASNEIMGLVGDWDSASSKININTASLEELQTLSGIGPKTAEKIINHRQEKKFEKIEDIQNVSGIGEKTFEDIKENIRVR